MQLSTLSLRYCQQVNEETLEIIAESANPFFLKELYLDGCEKITDQALVKLTRPREIPFPVPDLDIFVNKNETLRKQLSSYAYDILEYNKLITSVTQCGSRALEVISLAECRHISDSGIKRLAKCQLLRKVCFLGCANLKDEGMIELTK